MVKLSAHAEAVAIAEKKLALKAAENIKTFVKYIDVPGVPVSEDPDCENFYPDKVIPAAHHNLILSALQEVESGKLKRLMLFMPPGSAKALALDTPIPTPNGWKAMGDLVAGDMVFDENGAPCNVTWVSPVWKDRPVYRVTTDCGDEIIADEDHEWLTWDSGVGKAFNFHCRQIGIDNRQYPDDWHSWSSICASPTRYSPGVRTQMRNMRGEGMKASEIGALLCRTPDAVMQQWNKPETPTLSVGAKIVTTTDISKTLRYQGGANHTIPAAKALTGNFVYLGISPYVMGYLLGDGDTKGGGRVACEPQDRDWLIKEFVAEGIDARPHASAGHFGAMGIQKPWRDMGLCDGKKVPSQYLRASIEQRIALVQGLIDSDGYVDGHGSYRFTNTNRDLIDGFLELTRSLGLVPRLYEREPRRRKGQINKRSWDVLVSSFLPLARIPRKEIKARHDWNREQRSRRIVSCDPAGIADTVCIEVDSPSHLFLCGRSMTPTHNSTYASVVFPPWYIGRNPKHSIIATSYGSDLAKKFGRKCRSIVRSQEYQNVFNTTLSGDNSAVDDWSLTNGSQYMSGGILSGITGNRAHGLLIDDPVRGREDADSDVIRNKTWESYLSDLRSRLAGSNGWIVIIQCMTGDTPVLMADGKEKPLRDIRPGDRVATYEDGKVATSTVRNWVNHGPDKVWTIKMKSGITVKANARHPFLVEKDGKTEWRRTASIKRGTTILRVTKENGPELSVPQTDVPAPPNARGCACPTTVNIGGRAASDHLRTIMIHTVNRTCATAMELIRQSMTAFLPSRMAFALFVARRGPTENTGKLPFASIIATTPGKSEDCSATTVIWQSVTEKLKRFFVPPLTTFAIVRDTVDSIAYGDIEDVFDIQVDRTENFIANGLVSHNTRWSEDDLAGRILPENYEGQSGWVTARDGESWYVINMPAQCEREDDLLGRKPGEWLWPDWFTPEHWEQERRTQGPRNWSALFQQRPAPEEGDYFKREWFRYYTTAPDLNTLRIYGASDYAVTEDGGDWTVHGVVGVDPDDNIYVLDIWRQRTSPDVWIEAFLDLCDTYKPEEWGEEAGQIKRSVGPFIKKRQMERKIWTYRRQYPSSTNKSVRAQSIRGRAAMNKLYLPRNATWMEPFLNELLVFPSGRYDDQVDFLSLIGRMLDHMSPGQKPKDPEARIPENTITLDALWKAEDKKRARGYI